MMGIDEILRFGDAVPHSPTLPVVKVPRVWPNFDEDEDRDSLRSICNEIDSLWSRITNAAECRIDDPKFHGPTAEFWFSNDEVFNIYSDHYGDARVALANLNHLRESLETEFNRPAIQKVDTEPKAKTLWLLLESQMRVLDATRALNALETDHDHPKAITLLSSILESTANKLRAEVEKFLVTLDHLALNGKDEPAHLNIIARHDSYTFERLGKTTGPIPPKTFRLACKIMDAGEDGLDIEGFAAAAGGCGIEVGGNAKAPHLTKLRRLLPPIGVTIPNDVKTTKRYRFVNLSNNLD